MTFNHAGHGKGDYNVPSFLRCTEDCPWITSGHKHEHAKHRDKSDNSSGTMGRAWWWCLGRWVLYWNSRNLIYDLNGQPFTGPKHPGNEPSYATVKISGKGDRDVPGGFVDATHNLSHRGITLEFPYEFLVSVSGHTSVLPRLATGKDVIRSLTFKTNKKTYGPYGDEEGTPFSLPIENGLIVGFKGRSGFVLDAIGFYLSL
ncbi:hypothetical protein L484_023729 [Morus notabilis]|uniref:Jacalin-type lectin domain-containing protein n=1 Tax=Morus notabilis TaxID=981085 RepID=W9RCR9_9ROSA|nr:hypothetical protein L484_023729 [Morus notabilis]